MTPDQAAIDVLAQWVIATAMSPAEGDSLAALAGLSAGVLGAIEERVDALAARPNPLEVAAAIHLLADES